MSLLYKVNASDVKKAFSRINFYCKNLHSVGCASLGSKLKSYYITYTISDAICMKNWIPNFEPTHPSIWQKWTFDILYTLSRDPSRVLSTDPSCPRSYWMAPKVVEVSTVLDFPFGFRSFYFDTYIFFLKRYVSKRMKIPINMNYVKCILHNYLTGSI